MDHIISKPVDESRLEEELSPRRICKISKVIPQEYR